MKICILTPRFPFPENGGDVLRINAIARYLKEKGSQLCLCSYTEGKVTEENLIKAKCLYDNIYYIKRNKLASLFYSFISLLSSLSSSSKSTSKYISEIIWSYSLDFKLFK